MSKKIKKEIMKIKVDIKPQNTVAMALSNYSGGCHQKSNKAKRQQAKMNLKKDIYDSHNEKIINVFFNL